MTNYYSLNSSQPESSAPVREILVSPNILHCYLEADNNANFLWHITNISNFHSEGRLMHVRDYNVVSYKNTFSTHRKFERLAVMLIIKYLNAHKFIMECVKTDDTSLVGISLEMIVQEISSKTLKNDILAWEAVKKYILGCRKEAVKYCLLSKYRESHPNFETTLCKNYQRILNKEESSI